MYPVFELTLKPAKQEDYDMAYYMAENAAVTEFGRHRNNGLDSSSAIVRPIFIGRFYFRIFFTGL